MSLTSLLVLLAGIIVYLVFPRAEQNLLVLLEIKSADLTKQHLQYLGPVKTAFHIQMNIDQHMEHVDVQSRTNFNFAIITEHFSSEENSFRFGDHLQKLKFVEKFKVFPFTSSPVRRHAVNLLVKSKVQ